MMMDIFAKCLFLALLTTRTNAETRFLRTEYEKPSRILSEERPVMHTFYHKIEKEHYFHGQKTTGMSDDDDLRLIKAWEEAWQQAGWDTRVIGLKEAMEHPEFEDFDKRFEDAKKLEGGKLFGYYDKLCFHRWMAMASVGGGWMSDYDTFPLRQTPITKLPHGGKFTLYDVVSHGGGVPSLASGSKEEYERISHALMTNIYEEGVKHKFWSDMLAFMSLKTEYNTEKHVMKGRNAFALWKEPDAVQDCDIILMETWAVHFSHSSITGAVRAGYLDSSTVQTIYDRPTSHDRPELAKLVIKDLLQKCDTN